ncbi:MAG: amidohydrolase family protein [Candidatus Terrybacteria bacterium]|nr:amidohydrolase family protein [Candidatus Terrybacteria bacterium]
MDILIQNGTILDGTGAVGRKGDIAIRNGKIRALGEGLRERADQTIDAKGMIVAPGFVDILNHSDAYLTILKNPASESLLSQGITTAVIGNCGASLAPITHGNLISAMQKWSEVRDVNVDWERFGELLDVVDRFRPGVNIAGLVGHTTLRRAFIGDAARDVTEDELNAMVTLLEGAFDEGAFGLSFAPSYVHARGTPAWEIDALAQTVGRGGGYLAVHLRNEGADIVEAVTEAVGIAKRAEIPLQISHLKPSVEGETHFSEALERIEAAAREGVNIHFDVFPWRTSFTVLYLLFPHWVQEGGFSAMRKRLQDGAIRSRAIQEMQQQNIPWDHYIVAEAKRNKNAIGKSVTDIGRIMGVAPAEAAVNLFIEHEGRVLLLRRGGDLALLQQALRHSRSFIASAGGGYRKEDAVSGARIHPRSFGTMAKFLGKFIHDEKLLSLEEAIAKISGRPAVKIGLRDRGTLALGNAADIVVFDAEHIRNNATIAEPFAYPSGIAWVVVNGAIAVNPDGITGARAGRALRKAVPGK